ncbi:uncharacterized protein LOC143470325 [Clavelina lepadiformis]|uniref:uncharacterized protein LOC143470325 n=1 Tax=Clavelina lepadiformis TaxID=159417 RepID=UPI0040434E62
MDLDVINDHPGRGFSTRRTSPSPTLPTPPPTYEDVVKTEEDWNRVITQLGEASAAALRERRAAEELQVTYDLDVSDDESKAPSSQSSYTSESEMTSRSSFTLSSGSTVELESVRTEVASQGSIGQ